MSAADLQARDAEEASPAPWHLDPAKILRWNAHELADAKRRQGADFLGPQMTPHRKPNPGGGPCDVCGCLGLRLGVDHHALPALHSTGAPYVKYRLDCTKDTVETYLGWDGKPHRRAPAAGGAS